MPSGGFEDRVREVVLVVRPGDVVTYGEVAEEAGYPGAARAVGRVMATSDGLPWWRVVTSTGRLVPGHEIEHARRLKREGVAVVNGRVAFGRTRAAGYRRASRMRPPPSTSSPP
jgi:methylated-DNA-protein-cysteine methyltransferase related protein